MCVQLTVGMPPGKRILCPGTKLKRLRRQKAVLELAFMYRNRLQMPQASLKGGQASMTKQADAG